MNILLTGATGFIGRHLQQRLQKQGHEVIACVHHQTFTAENTITVDFAQDHSLHDWLPRLQQIDVVINCVGIISETPTCTFKALHTQAPIALFQACEKMHIQRVIQISALGADDTADTAYHLSKRAADEALLALDLDAYIVRPSLVYGAGGSSFSLFSALAALPVLILPAGGQQRIQPIAIHDLITAIVQCVEGKVAARQIYPLVGPKALTLRAFLADIRAWLGYRRQSIVFSGSYALFFMLAGLLEKITRIPLSRDNLRMLRRGNHADAQAFTHTFGFTASDLHQALAPPAIAEKIYSRLYFLHPLLLFSLAFTWCSAGLVSAFFYPLAESYALLQPLGITGVFATGILYSAAVLDILLGLALLHSRWRVSALYLQIGVMLFYTLLISLFLPEYWLHPFGPVVKNIPLLIASGFLLSMEDTAS